MKAIVTGATGFTGSALCRRLVADGWEVTAFVRESPRVAPLRALGIDCVEVDITDVDSVRNAMTPVDCVFHIAALFRTEDVDRKQFKRVNVDAVEYVAGAAWETGVGRFVHCSTVGVQGQIDDPPADETYRPRPNDHYQSTKWQGEQVARRYIENGLPGVVVRPAGIYGPGDMRFLKLFKAIEHNIFVMIGNGKTLYHLTYIDDLIDGFMLAAEKQEALGEVFTIAGPRYTTVQELADTVARILEKKPPRLRVPLWPVQVAAKACEAVCRPFGINPPLYPRRVEFFAMDRAFTTEKAQRLLNYTPRFDIQDGLTASAKWYRKEGLLKK
ncbi:NAD-dependent epimerase/dehydratase family protein [Methylonatrum kenyense]|uniref:NAD-dependent epimerase/dehydratase family protein n=1 Tax=Methylonatrum kenyense TaxID=455253 RepID=UPI0020C02AA2|nr:NAD-dependent epimerase/dehydratase family protein [Methylonatrum kenyense]MCK8516812.1 NAD-dependent epimerase/dehydratase family protein [Methylonatrum kenyense]